MHRLRSMRRPLSGRCHLRGRGSPTRSAGVPGDQPPVLHGTPRGAPPCRRAAPVAGIRRRAQCRVRSVSDDRETDPITGHNITEGAAMSMDHSYRVFETQPLQAERDSMRADRALADVEHFVSGTSPEGPPRARGAREWRRRRRLAMSDLVFGATVWWTGCGRDGAGGVSTGGQEFEYSAPLSMGGRGIGTSPEELLVSAVASCYAGTLYHLLARDGLPADQVTVRAAGSVSDYPSRRASFSRIVVHPTFSGADPIREAEYGTCARTAREQCFIGKALRADIRYEVGDVIVQSPALVDVEVE